ncbi:hypothetical protein GGX14DRAFT_401423 [Mycena pura]|uniref:Uncharacterized protein n=1 Tax=Mycena pura TaxID=153505 RepID=A0AAD6YAM2_9AGAR|nr:hypothetical protein GGX14DRAFT_401423 [Mycena pura]
MLNAFQLPLLRGGATETRSAVYSYTSCCFNDRYGLNARLSSDSGSKSAPLTTANTVASTSKDASSKPKGATYFIPTATLTGYNLFGKSFTDDGKKKIPREQVKAEYQRPENKQRWDKIAKERKAQEKNKTEAAAAPAESQPA